MKAGFTFCRLSLLTIASIYAAIAIIIVTLVIPPVRADIFPKATPETATTAFWVCSLFFLFFAGAVFLIARRITEGGMTGSLVAIGVLALILSSMLWDAAAAFQSHGPALGTADTLIFTCAALGSLASILLIATVFPLRRLSKTRASQSAVSSDSSDV